MSEFFTKHAKIFAIGQLLSALIFGGCSIWYGAWYPDAKTNLYDQQKLENPNPEKPSFWDVSFSKISISTPVGYTGIALIFGVLSGAGIVVSASRLTELEKKESEFKQEQENHAETQQYYYDALKDHLVNFFCNQVSCFDDTCRASVYRHDANSQLFRMVFRYCKITRFGSKGRLALPEHEGVVGATFLNGEFVYIASLPNKLSSKTYLKDINKKLEGLGTSNAENTLSRLRMQSRCYFGYAIRDVISGEKFAILIIESTNENHFNPNTIVNLLSGQHTQIAKYVRHIVNIDSKLNPYGGA
ncbi:MAG: hypothetical protein ACXW04_09800 [Methylobacter sp.]